MEKEYSLFIYPKAAQDMDGIFDYICNKLCNPTAAINQIDEFEQSLNLICSQPLSCPLVNNEYVKDASLRKLVVNNYIVFYKVDDKKEQINVVRVLYGMMNFKEIL